MDNEQFQDFKERLIQRGDLCPICQSRLTAGDAMRRPVATTVVASRGASSNPRKLCYNYIQCTFVCSEACGAVAKTYNDQKKCSYIPYETAVRVIAENRAPTDKCSIMIFPPMSDNAMISCIIVEETMYRISVLISQSKSRGQEEVSHILDSFRGAIDRYFHDREFATQYGLLDLLSPFDSDSSDGKIFAQYLTIFAVHSANEEKTIFEEAIVANIAPQLHMKAVEFDTSVASNASDANDDPILIVFPLQIEIGKKIGLKMSTEYLPRYELRKVT